MFLYPGIQTSSKRMRKPSLESAAGRERNEAPLYSPSKPDMIVLWKVIHIDDCRESIRKVVFVTDDGKPPRAAESERAF